MNGDRIFNCSLGVLQAAGRDIAAVIENHPEVAAKLKTGLKARIIQLNGLVADAHNDQKGSGADRGVLTVAQNDALKSMNASATTLRGVAAKAFKGQDVKLAEEFPAPTPSGGSRKYGDIVTRNSVLLASCRKAANIAPLSDWGWKPENTTAYAELIDAATAADTVQNEAKPAPVAATAEQTALANELHTGILMVQSTVDVMFPDTPGNKAVRMEFLIGTYPPPVPRRGPPTIPKILSTTPGPAGGAQISLNYRKSEGANDYVITVINKATGANLRKITTTANECLLAFDGTLSGTEIEITVIARNESGQSKPSKTVTMTIP